MIIDGQWGSTGKGKIAGYLAIRNDISVATSDFQANAGHTWVGEGKVHGNEKYVVRHIPMAFLNTGTILCLNPGSGILLDVLMQELEMTHDYDVRRRLKIHPNAGVITADDTALEGRELVGVASTMKGCGAALARKVMRKATLAKDVPELRQFLADTTKITNQAIRAGGTVLLESAQGFDLSLNHGKEYPYTTSRDVTTASVLSNAGVPPHVLGRVIGSLRTHPIRVGNVYDRGVQLGYSGNYYSDQCEISWPDLQEWSGAKEPVVEKTTVTGRVRRVFTWSHEQFIKFCTVCGPTDLFINFINHVNAEDYGKRTWNELSEKSREWIYDVERSIADSTQLHVRPDVTYIGTGPKDSEMVCRL